MIDEIRKDTTEIIKELICKANLEKESVLVIGCSSSEVVGGNIGKDSSMEVAKVIYEEIATEIKKNNMYLAAQCCEHLNRALVIEKELANKLNLEIVRAVPKQHAGGAFATTAYLNMTEPVLVEEIKADAGIDIGGTLIGMHLKRVAVPLRLSKDKLYKANIICAYTRPKYIGGIRAEYE